MKTVLILSIFISLVLYTRSARILGIFPVPCRSHLNVFHTLTKELATRGHELVVISPFPSPNPPENHTDIVVMNTIRDFYEENSKLNFYTYDLPIYFPFFYWMKSLNLIRLMFSDPGVQNLVHDSRGFDLVICEDLVSESLCAFSDYFKAPRVMISSIGGYHMINYAVGNPLALSYVPNVVMPYTHHMSFSQRLKNFIITYFWDVGNEIFYLPGQEAIRKQVFGDNTSTVWEMRNTASLVLLNNHFSLNYPRPLLPSVIEVGGLHVKTKPDPLPQDIKKFLDEGKQGVIYFSMGSNLRSDYLSSEKLQGILTAFSQLPYRVLMKWESESSLPGQPKNVKLGKWLPQQDILAHPNVILFITHGGLMSAQEAAYHGIPLVGIPVYGDQEMNMLKAVDDGYAVMLYQKNITKTSILWAISTALQPRQKAMKRSEIFKDQPETPLDRAVFWIEYVIRHGGAPQLRSASIDLAWYQRHMVDVVFFLICFTLTLFYILYSYFCRNYTQDKILSKKIQ